MLDWYISKLEAENRQLKAMIGDAEFVSQFDAETRARFDRMIGECNGTVRIGTATGGK